MNLFPQQLKAAWLIVCLILFAWFPINQINGQDFWGGPITGNWILDSNWQDGTVPADTDDVFLTVVGTPYTVQLFNISEVNSVQIDSADATLLVSSAGGFLDMNVNQGIDVSAGRLLTLGAVRINAQNGISLSGGELIPTNHSTLVVENGLQNSATGTVNVRGVRNSSGTATFGAELEVRGDLTNEGLLKLETSRGTNGGVFSLLDIVGELNNSGTIDSRPFEGAGVGAKRVWADSVNNSGSIVNNDSTRLEFRKSGADYVNSGTISAAADEIRFQDLESFENQASGQLTGTQFTFDSEANLMGSVTNAGLIDVSGDIDFVQIQDIQNTGTIHSASGEIVSSTSITTIDNQGTISTGTSGSISISNGDYLHGAQADISSGSLTIFATDIALTDGFTTDSPVVNLGSSTITGNGVYQSQSGTTTSVTFLNVNPTIAWENSGLVQLASTNGATADFNSGITNLPGSELKIRGIRNSTGSATFGARFRVIGTVANEGTIGFETFRSGPNTFSVLDVAGTVENSGVIESRPFEGSNTSSRTLNADVVNNSGAIVQNDVGVFAFTRSNSDFSNSGQVNVNAGEMRIQNLNSFSNTGSINAATGTELWIRGINGSTFLNGIDGVVSGSGLIEVQTTAIDDDGKISPGASTGILTIRNPFRPWNQSTSGVLEMEIAGTTAGLLHDQLVFTGTAVFDGTLRLIFQDGFAPIQDDTFDLVIGNLTENFQNIEIEGLQPGFNFDLQVSGGTLTLTALNDAAAIVIGDTNGDGLINLLDIGPFVNFVSSGQFNAAADINQDGLVNLLDIDPFVQLLSN